MEQKELELAIEAHHLFLLNNNQGKCLNLTGRDLRQVNLSNMDLTMADFTGANLSLADLSQCNLTHVNFNRVDLSFANLMGANLSGATFDHAVLMNTQLRNVSNLPLGLINQYEQSLYHLLSLLPLDCLLPIKEGLIKGTIDGRGNERGESGLIRLILQIMEIELIAFASCYTNYYYYLLGIHNPAEQLFALIRLGDDNRNSQFAKIALQVANKLIEQQSPVYIDMRRSEDG